MIHLPNIKNEKKNWPYPTINGGLWEGQGVLKKKVFAHRSLLVMIITTAVLNNCPSRNKKNTYLGLS